MGRCTDHRLELHSPHSPSERDFRTSSIFPTLISVHLNLSTYLEHKRNDIACIHIACRPRNCVSHLLLNHRHSKLHKSVVVFCSPSSVFVISLGLVLLLARRNKGKTCTSHAHIRDSGVEVTHFQMLSFHTASTGTAPTFSTRLLR